ncbi:ABC transporter ATP-binding protein [Tropicimonas sp. IMCC34011]|uniref:ABC transporter ATP-binding protein n=1 Tax=Tropicimonas sp. IMCC34011 TaxID=2248759 RepID=UPI000E2784F7|nr:ABC transporter ATP-binding protein [Tropicimonas sp. IMCC34011]
MSKSGASLEVRNLHKSWGQVEVLKAVDFDINAGGFLTLLGPSGCGKSTLLRLICGLDEVSGGEILIDGQVVTGKAAAERNLGMVFQNYALFPHMTIEENIAYGLKIRKVPTAEKKKQLDRVADLMALGPLLNRRPGQLSGGQQQRVALARVLVSGRPLVLMDEPLSNLDAKLRVEIRSEIRSLNKKLGITIVYVTHDQSEALSMSDRIVLMNAGEVAQIGTPEELYERPANTFSATFIGTPPTNIIDSSEVEYPADLNIAGGHDVKDCLFGIRPECIGFPTTDKNLRVKARVKSVEYEGKVFLIHLETAAGTSIVQSYSGPSVPQYGEEVTLGWAREHTHMFSKKDGRVITVSR